MTAPWHVGTLSALIRRLPRGRYTALAHLVPHRGRFDSALAEDAGGARFACDLSDQISREVCFTGLYEPPFTRVFLEHARPGGVVVDAGANWGYFTLVAASAVGSRGRVIALEPDPRQHALLAGNVALNAFSNVTVLPIAASSASGRLTLTGYADNDANRGVSSIAIAADEGTGRRFEVACATIDELTAEHASVDLVKIDVEGAEDLVLQGMREGLAAKRYRAILLELHPALLAARGVAPEACLEPLIANRYRGATIDASAAAYRRACDPATRAETLLGPVDSWRGSTWPHLLWLC